MSLVGHSTMDAQDRTMSDRGEDHEKEEVTLTGDMVEHLEGGANFAVDKVLKVMYCYPSIQGSCELPSHEGGMVIGAPRFW